MLAYKFKLANMDVNLEFNDVKEVKFQNFVTHIKDTLKKQLKDSALEKSFATMIISLRDGIKPFMQIIIEAYSSLPSFCS